MDDLELIQAGLQRTKLKDIDAVASSTGVSRHTLIKIKYGTTTDPQWATVKPLVAYFRAKAKRKERAAA